MIWSFLIICGAAVAAGGGGRDGCDGRAGVMVAAADKYNGLVPYEKNERHVQIMGGKREDIAERFSARRPHNIETSPKFVLPMILSS